MMTLSKQRKFTFNSPLEDIRGSWCCVIKVRQYTNSADPDQTQRSAQVLHCLLTLCYILRDFKNAPFYILCLFHMINLRMLSLSFLSSCKMDHDLPLFRFAHAVQSDVIST